MRVFVRNIGVAVVFIAVAWIADSAIDAVFFNDESFVELLFRDVPPVEVYMRTFGAILLVSFATVISILSLRMEAAHEALRESEARYRAYVENAPDAVFVVNEKGRYIDVNEGATRLLGYSRGELLALSIPEITAPESMEDSFRGFATLQESGKLSMEVTLLRKDGSRVPISLDAVALPNHRFMAFSADITERKRMETALREDEKRFRDLVESTSDWIWEVDVDGRYTYCSHRITGVLGYRPEEILGKTPFELMPEAEAAGVREIFLGIVAERQPIVDLKNWNLSKDGREVCLLTNGVPMFDEKGEFLGYRGADKDITQRIQAEERLKASETRYSTVFEQASDLIFLLEPIPDGPPVIRDANPTALNSLGYERDELVGMPTSLVDAAASPEALIPERRRIARQGSGRFEVLHRRRDGSTFLVEAAVRHVRIGGENLAISVERDVTERRRMEEELRDSRDRLRKLAVHIGEVREEERRLLARELHDEVGMGLTAMRMDLTRAKGGFPEGPEAFAEWLNSMFDLVDDAVARVNRLSDELRSPILELIGIEAAILAQAEETRSWAGMEFELALELGDIERSPERDLALFRIFQEAMSNVIRHAEAHRVEVTLRRSGEDILLEVRDDGVGVSEEQLQNEDSFGLMGMRERAQAVGGRVEISGEPGGGTRAVAVIPIGSA